MTRRKEKGEWKITKLPWFNVKQQNLRSFWMISDGWDQGSDRCIILLFLGELSIYSPKRFDWWVG